MFAFAQSGLRNFFPHDRTLDVYMRSNWLVGENRLCWLGVQSDANGKPTGKLDKLVCPAGGSESLEPHNVTVTFKGPIDPVDKFGNQLMVADQWICKRGDDKFTCVAKTNSSN